MRNSRIMRRSFRFVVFSAVLCAFTAMPLLSSAQPTTAVNIVNNSSRQIRNVYLSHVDSDDWSGNQLGNTTIGPGQSFSLNNVACDQQQVKIIGEDQDGCFVSTVLNCGDSALWTITNESARDCGN